MKGGELAEDEERTEGLALVLSTLVREKEVEVKEEKVMEEMYTAEYLQVNELVQQERSRACMKDCNANSFWSSTQFFSGGAFQGGFDVRCGEHRGGVLGQ